MESNQGEQKREKRIMQKKNRELSDSIKHNLHIIGFPEVEERKSGQRIYLKK